LRVTINREKFNEKKSVAVPITFDIVHYFLKDDGKDKEAGEIIVDLINPNHIKENKKPIIQNFTIEKPNKRLRLRLSFNSIKLTTAGRYFFVVKMRMEGEKRSLRVAELPLDVIFLDEDKKEWQRDCLAI
jgi:hypothetical protein